MYINYNHILYIWRDAVSWLSVFFPPNQITLNACYVSHNCYANYYMNSVSEWGRCAVLFLVNEATRFMYSREGLGTRQKHYITVNLRSCGHSTTICIVWTRDYVTSYNWYVSNRVLGQVSHADTDFEKVPTQMMNMMIGTTMRQFATVIFGAVDVRRFVGLLIFCLLKCIHANNGTTFNTIFCIFQIVQMTFEKSWNCFVQLPIVVVVLMWPRCRQVSSYTSCTSLLRRRFCDCSSGDV